MIDACHHGNERTRCAICEQSPFYCGAAIVGGFIGMAIEIRNAYMCKHCGSWEGSWDYCPCENDE